MDMPKNCKKPAPSMRPNCYSCVHNHALTYADCKQMQYKCVLRFAATAGKPAYDTLRAIQEKEYGAT